MPEVCKKRREKITESEIQEAISLYKGGKGTRYIARYLHRDEKGIVQHLKWHRVYKAGAKQGNFWQLPFTDEINNTIIRLYVREQKSSTDIAKLYGFDDGRIIWIRLQKLGVKIRSKKEAAKLRMKDIGEAIRLKIDDLLLIEMYAEQKKRASTIADVSGVCVQLIRQRLGELGLLLCRWEIAKRSANARKHRSIIKRQAKQTAQEQQKEVIKLTDYQRKLIIDNYEEIRQRVSGLLFRKPMVKKMIENGRAFDSIVTEVMSYLSESAMTYDLSKGASFISYAVGGCLLRLVDSQRPNLAFGRHTLDKQNFINEIRDKVAKEHNSFDDFWVIEELKSMGYTDTQISSLMEASRRTLESVEINIPSTSDKDSLEWQEDKRKIYRRVLDYLLQPEHRNSGRIMLAVFVEDIMASISGKEPTPIENLGHRFNVGTGYIYGIKTKFLRDEKFKALFKVLVNPVELAV